MKFLILGLIIFGGLFLVLGLYIQTAQPPEPLAEQKIELPENAPPPTKIPESQIPETSPAAAEDAQEPKKELSSCVKIGGYVCAETSEETCGSSWLKASDSDRCCASKCVSQPVYTENPETGKINLRNCYPNENKNKVAVIIKKNGIYDNPAVALAISDYLDAVRKNLGMENAGLKKFSGLTMSDFNKFVDKLYLDENAAYMILAGDDLPNAEVTETNQLNQSVVLSGLAFVNRDSKPEACIDIAFSQIVPRLLDPNEEKVNFVISRFRKYAEYHQNPLLYLNQYQKKVLRIQHDPKATQIGAPLTFYPLGYQIVTEEIFNSDHEAVRNALNEKSLIARFDVHGLQNLVGIGINGQNLPADSYSAYYTTIQEYSDFVKKNGPPSLFVDAGACQATTIKYRDEKFCCWPQTFLESDAWAYYSFSIGSGGIDTPVTKAMLEEKFIGKAVRKTSPPSYFIFGDILARLSI